MPKSKKRQKLGVFTATGRQNKPIEKCEMNVAEYVPEMKYSRKSIHNRFSYCANNQTNKLTNYGSR